MSWHFLVELAHWLGARASGVLWSILDSIGVSLGIMFFFYLGSLTCYGQQIFCYFDPGNKCAPTVSINAKKTRYTKEEFRCLIGSDYNKNINTDCDKKTRKDERFAQVARNTGYHPLDSANNRLLDHDEVYVYDIHVQNIGTENLEELILYLNIAPKDNDKQIIAFGPDSLFFETISGDGPKNPRRNKVVFKDQSDKGKTNDFLEREVGVFSCLSQELFFHIAAVFENQEKGSNLEIVVDCHNCGLGKDNLLSFK